MSLSLRSSSIILLTCVCLLWGQGAAARYPRVARDAQGSWIAADEALIRVVGELFSFYGSADGLPSDRVRMVAPDEREVWAATPRGLGRMDRNSRRWEAFHAPDPLPSDDVYGVAVDDRYVWVGTARGVARWDKLGKTWSLVGLDQGPGQAPVFDIRSLGSTVWFGCADGVWQFDRQTGQWRLFGPEEGFTVGAVREILQLGENLWFLADGGLARFDLRSAAVTIFTEKHGLPSTMVTAFAQVAGEIWIGTDRGLVIYQPGSDAISPFLYQKGMPAGQVVGIEVATPWVWVATDQGLGVFNTMTRVWEEKRQEDGLSAAALTGMSMAGSQLVLLQDGSFQGYHTQRDDWATYPVDDVWAGKAGEQGDPSKLRFNFELIASGEANLTTTGSGWSHEEQIVPDMRLGLGTVLEGDRTLDASVRLDFGDATTPGIREYDAELRFRGNDTDSLRELLISDELRLEDREEDHDLLDDAWLEGIGVYQRLGDSNGRQRDLVEVATEAGVRRGVRSREFFRGSIEYTYQLAHPHVTARSEVVKVDGTILDRDVDYILTHTTGLLTFLNPDRVNALSLIDITYTYEQIPRKDTASTSILEMLPWDNELGSFTRSGSPVYVTDEGGLYAQINGAAPKYLDRGWMESVFQDYVQGSTSLSLQIHDMGSPENALEIFDYDRPISYVVLWDEPESTALLDESLPSSYAVKMRLDGFYVELSVDDKSKSAEILVGLFAQAVRTKGDLSGTRLTTLRPITGRVRVGVNPSEHFGLGAGFLGASDLEDESLMASTGLARRTLELGTVDLWTRHRLGSGDWGGELSSYFQAGRSAFQLGRDPSLAGEALSGDVVYNSQALNIRLDGEIHSREFEAGGTRDTTLGTFAGDIRADATINPVRWLRLRLLYDHERSYLAPELGGGDGYGINENLIGKLTFMRAKWPTLWFLAGRSVLEGGGHRDEKLRLAGSLEYDLAHGILSGLGLKKMAVKAYFDHSENEVPVLVDEHSPLLDPLGRERWLLLGSSPGTAQNMRFEFKFAPTATEDAYARFERKTFEPEERSIAAAGDGPLALPSESWELIAGAASRWLPGLVPTFNGKMTYREGRESSGDETQTAQAILAGQLELFPGRWWEPLGSTMLSVGYGYTNGEEAEGQTVGNGAIQWGKTVHLVKDQVEAKGSFGNYDDVFRVESRSKWWSRREGEGQVETEVYFEVLNRLTFRPVYTSPITLRVDYAQLDQLNPEQDRMGSVRALSPSVEWERRWSHDLVTKVRIEVPWRVLDDSFDEVRALTQNYQEWSLKPWIEVRLRLRDVWGDSMLRLSARAYHQWIRPFRTGPAGSSAAEKGREFYGALWLDWDRPGSFLIRLGAVYLWHLCQDLDVVGAEASGECLSQHAIQPSFKAIVRF